MIMRKLIVAGLLLLGSAVLAGASAQTALRIGLADDPDMLDPTLARTYVGRIVFDSSHKLVGSFGVRSRTRQ